MSERIFPPIDNFIDFASRISAPIHAIENRLPSGGYGVTFSWLPNGLHFELKFQESDSHRAKPLKLIRVDLEQLTPDRIKSMSDEIVHAANQHCHCRLTNTAST